MVISGIDIYFVAHLNSMAIDFINDSSTVLTIICSKTIYIILQTQSSQKYGIFQSHAPNQLF